MVNSSNFDENEDEMKKLSTGTAFNHVDVNFGDLQISTISGFVFLKSAISQS